VKSKVNNDCLDALLSFMLPGWLGCPRAGPTSPLARESAPSAGIS
jgi:hypothetical protein